MGLPQGLVSQVIQRAGGVEPKKTIGGFLGNTITSGANLVGDLANTVLHPIDTAKSLYNLGTGIIQLAIPGEQGNEELARAVGKFYVDRYGSLDKAWNSLYNDPIGVAMDASVLLGGAGAGLKGIAGLATVGAEATDLASNAARIGRLGSKLSKISAVVDPLNVGSKAELLPTKLRPNISGSLKSKIADFGDNYAIKSTRINDRNQAKLAKTMRGMNTKYGSNLQELVDTTGLYGQDLGAVDKYIKPLEQFRDAQIVKSGATATSGDLLKSFANQIAELSTPEALRDPASRALRTKLLEEARLFAEQNPTRRMPISLESLNATRKSLDFNTPNAQFESGKAALQRSLGNVYRDTVNTSAGTGQAGRELAVLYKFRDMLEKAPKGKNTLPMGITQSIATGTGLLSGGNPLSRIANGVIGYGASSVINSPRFIGKLSKTAKGVSDFQMPAKMSDFLRNAGSLSGGVYDYSRASSRFSPLNREFSQQEQPSRNQQVPARTYRPSIAPKQPTLTTEIKWKKPKNAFKNNAAFGKSFTLKARN